MKLPWILTSGKRAFLADLSSPTDLFNYQVSKIGPGFNENALN